MVRFDPVAPRPRNLFVGALIALIFGCDQIENPKPNQVDFTIVQIGDVEDLRSPAVKNRLAIVAAIKSQLKAENEQTYLVMPGDLFNPSHLANVDFAGKRVAGRNLVEVMNAADVDFATFGNHEFDLEVDEFKTRLEESNARWVSSNVIENPPEKSASKQGGTFFAEAPPYRIFEVKNTYGKKVRIAILGLTMAEGGHSNFLARKDPIEAARSVADELSRKHDIILALTHQNTSEDRKLAHYIPEIQAIFGGHQNSMVQDLSLNGYNLRVMDEPGFANDPARSQFRIHDDAGAVVRDLTSKEASDILDHGNVNNYLKTTVAADGTTSDLDDGLKSRLIEKFASNAGYHPTPVFKASLNLSSFWIHRCSFDIETRKLSIDSEQIIFGDDGHPSVAEGDARQEMIAEITEPSEWIGQSRANRLKRDQSWLKRFKSDPKSLENDPAAKKVLTLLNEWETRYNAAFPRYHRREHENEGDSSNRGVEHHDKKLVSFAIAHLLDSRQESVRKGPTPLTRLVALSMLEALDGEVRSAAVPELKSLPRIALFNSGMIRINEQIDLITKITLEDIQRIVPFSRDPVIRGVKMKGSLIHQLLQHNKENQAQGSFLQAFDARGKPLIRKITPDNPDPESSLGKNIDNNQDYLVAIDDYLIDGNESDLRWLGAWGRQDESTSLKHYDQLKSIGGVRIALENYLERWARERRTELWIDENVGEGRPLPAPHFARRTYVIQALSKASAWNRSSLTAQVDTPEDADPLLEQPETSFPAKLAMDVEENMLLENDEINRLRLACKLLRLRPRSRRAARLLLEGLKSTTTASHDAALEMITHALPEGSPALLAELLSKRLVADEITRVELDELLARYGPEHARETTPKKTVSSGSDSP